MDADHGGPYPHSSLCRADVARRIDVQATPGFSRLFGFEWPSLPMAIEFLAWHLFFGLALLLAAFGFRAGGKEGVVRIDLFASGVLCLAVGPAWETLSGDCPASWATEWSFRWSVS